MISIGERIEELVKIASNLLSLAAVKNGGVLITSLDSAVNTLCTIITPWGMACGKSYTSVQDFHLA